MNVDEKTSYMLGLWMADRCSTAKGVFGIRNKNQELLNVVRDFIKQNDIEPKERDVQGFSLTHEVYCCRSHIRRFFEDFKLDRFEVLSKNLELASAFFAGLIDGDGSIYGKKSSLRIYYSKDDIQEAEIDSKILSALGFNTTIKQNLKVVTLYILKPRTFAPKLVNFVKSSHKLRELKILAA